MMYYGLSLLCLLSAIGLFVWIVIERTKYYQTANQKNKFLQMCATMGCIALLVFAIGFFSMDERKSRKME